MFLGVSIIADRFMASIEVITSQEKEVTITKPSGETVVATVRIWNETVSNLTLMALGSSAPEILLSVIEVCGHGFEAGEMGPGTIVGSAAFNMFVIVAVCVWVIPEGEVRRIKHLRVFFITASWSIFAYIWLYLILAVISPGVVKLADCDVILNGSEPGSVRGGKADPEQALSVEQEDAHRIAEMGKPVLGENSKLEVIIEESYEFKSTVDKLIKKTNLALVIGTHSWREQFIEAVTVRSGDLQTGRRGQRGQHGNQIRSFRFKFKWSLSSIAKLLQGSTVDKLIKKTNLALVIGTHSWREQFIEAVTVRSGNGDEDDEVHEEGGGGGSREERLPSCFDYAMHSLTVFWKVLFACVPPTGYWSGWACFLFRVEPGSLAFSVTLYTVLAFVVMGVLLWRRGPSVGGELGGPRPARVLTCTLFLGLWLLYVLFSSLEAYCYVNGF
ncbi:UNVERIFIED_CONTAM: hypothetical protein FKN15_038984 [Acipenser sinensis]